MSTHADKTPENKSRSPDNEFAQKQGYGESTFQYVDNRPEAIAQRTLQAMINNSPHVKQATQLQAMADNHSSQQQLPLQKKENNTGLPDNLKSGIENLSGYSMDDVKVHYNSDRPAQLQAHAYAQGASIHIAPGQEKHLPHEAWHVVQKKQGRVKPTVQMEGKVNINDDAGLEKEADVMGAKAIQLKVNSTVQQLNHDAGCGCPNCCPPVQKKGVSIGANTVSQLKTTINIKDASGTFQGESGNGSTTADKLAKWPSIDTAFNHAVKPVEVHKVDENGAPTEDTYTRGSHVCAEPNAFANILDKYSDKDQKTVTKSWLDSLQFPALAIDDGGRHLRPCSVCSQWVKSDGVPLTIKGNIKPNDPISNKAQIAEEEAKDAFSGKVDEIAGGQTTHFDTSGTTRGLLKSRIGYLDSLKAHKGKKRKIDEGSINAVHRQAWEGIIHENSADSFVSDARKFLNIMLDNMLIETVVRQAENRLEEKDDAAIKAIEEYYARCRTKTTVVDGVPTEPNNKLIVQFIAEIKDMYDSDGDDRQKILDGDVRDLDRDIAMLEVPDIVKDNDPKNLFVEITNGKLTITEVVTGDAWESDE